MYCNYIEYAEHQITKNRSKVPLKEVNEVLELKKSSINRFRKKDATIIQDSARLPEPRRKRGVKLIEHPNLNE